MTLRDLLIDLDACSPALEWVGDKTIEQAVKECNRTEWIGWLADELQLPKQIRCLAAGHAANTVRHLMKDEKSIKALDTAIAYGEGKATDEELEQVRDGAEDDWAARAAIDAADLASDGAWYAAWDAWDEKTYTWDAWAARDAARNARVANLQATAEIYRKYLGEEIINKVNKLIKPQSK